MAGAANGDRIEAGGDNRRYNVPLRQHKGEGAGPEGLGEDSRGVVGLADLFEGFVGSDVTNEWIVRGTGRRAGFVVSKKGGYSCESTYSW